MTKILSRYLGRMSKVGSRLVMLETTLFFDNKHSTKRRKKHFSNLLVENCRKWFCENRLRTKLHFYRHRNKYTKYSSESHVRRCCGRINAPSKTFVSLSAVNNLWYFYESESLARLDSLWSEISSYTWRRVGIEKQEIIVANLSLFLNFYST